MSESNQRQILSRLSQHRFVNREAELSRICSLASGANRVALLVGAPRSGKSELLRKCYDRLFDARGDTVPFYYSFSRSSLDLECFAPDFAAQTLAQFNAFRAGDPKLLDAANEPLAAVARSATAEDYLWARSVADSLARMSENGNALMMARLAASIPKSAGAHARLKPLLMIDNAHLLEGTAMRSVFLRRLAREAEESVAPTLVLTGLRRVITELITPDDEVFDRLDVIQFDSLDEDSVERFIRRQAESLGVATSDSSVELIVQQFNRDLFYTSAIVDAAARRGSLKSFMDVEKAYAGEMMAGRIRQYLDALFREVVADSRSERAALEVAGFVLEAGARVPVQAVRERIAEHSDADCLLKRLHSREFLDINRGFVRGPADPVTADYLRVKHRDEIAGAPGPLAGTELLGEKLKQSYELMMTRYNRAISSQLVELLSRFDSQTVPASLFNQDSFEKSYRGMSRVQVRRVLDDEKERLRLPQIVLVREAGAVEQPGMQWRIFVATGFDGGIYTDANEVWWLIALVNSKEPLDVETLSRIDQRLDVAQRAHATKHSHASEVVRWYISKEGFSAVASERLASLHARCSTFALLDLIQDHLTRLAFAGEVRPASEFELVIPVQDEAELIAARTAEQIARAADFDGESINQIKTAIIEACINAAEHGDSPDRKIYQRFAIDEDKLIITVSNKGKTFGWVNGQSSPSVGQPAKGTRGRGLQIIRALMDEVKFERTDDGASLVMTKFLKRPGNQ